jgi:hypothetical protein
MTTIQAPQPAPSWTVSIAGPDDVHRFDTELDALRFANQVNRTYLADLLAHPGDEVLCLATVTDASPALPTSPLRDTGVETPLLHTDRLNLMGRWFEGRGMTTMAHICRTAAAELKTIAERREEAVAKIVSSGPADMPLLQWLSADHSFRAPIGSRLYAAPPSQPKCLEDLMTKIQAFGLACYQHESGAEQIAMQDEIRIDLAALTASQVVDSGCDIKISAPAKTIKLGSYGQAFDLPGDRRAYTYKHQPGNQAAWRIGDASSRVEAGGDLIDRGLSLLKVLEAGGFGVFELDETAAIPAPEGEPTAAAVEVAAKAVYRLFIGADDHPWSEGGNSLKQCDARRYARAALAAQPAQEAQAQQAVAAFDRQIHTLAIDAVEALTRRPPPQEPSSAEGDALTTGRQYLLTPDYGAAMVEMAKHYDMSVDNVLRAAIRLYQAQRFGSIKIEHVRDSKLFDPDVQPKGTEAPADVLAALAEQVQELIAKPSDILAPEYAAALREMAAHYDMSEMNVLRAAIRLYQAQRHGSIEIVHRRESMLMESATPGESVAEVVIDTYADHEGRIDADVFLPAGTKLYAAAAQAPAPAPWRDHVEDRLRTWKQRTMNKSGDMLALDDFMDSESLEDLIDFVCDEWAEPATQAPAVGEQSNG